MLITIFFVALFILGFVLWVLDYECILQTDLFATSLTLSTVGVVGLLTCIILISIVHITDDVTIQQSNNTYNSLIERKEVTTSEYEDFSKSDVIRDITEWNNNVVSYKYWQQKPLTSWFYDKDVADNLKEIE